MYGDYWKRNLPLVLMLMMVIISSSSFLLVQEAKAAPTELSYDDGSAEADASAKIGQVMAVRFSLSSGVSRASY
jgi:hypothetical protein